MDVARDTWKGMFPAIVATVHTSNPFTRPMKFYADVSLCRARRRTRKRLDAHDAGHGATGSTSTLRA